MIVEPAVVDQILNSKIRRRVLEIPVTYSKGPTRPVHPKTGRQLAVARSTALTRPVQRRCPVREGGVYVLRPPVPYGRYKTEAQEQPTTARAVLLLYDLCNLPTRTVTITVTQPPERQGDTWIVRFEKGDWREQSDRPVFLARQNDFTMIASLQTVKGDPPLMASLAEDLERARAKALGRRVSPERRAVKQRADDADTLQRAMTNMKARTLVKRAQRNYEAAERLLSEQELHSPVVAAPDGSRGEEDRPPSANTLSTPEAA
jgi:hypothetical protein